MAAKHYGPNPKVVPNCASELGIANPAWNSDLHSLVLGLLGVRLRLFFIQFVSKAAKQQPVTSAAPLLALSGRWESGIKVS